MFLYRDILKKSLAITWRYKYLWFFGVFASLISGIGNYNIPFSQAGKEWESGYFTALARLSETGIFEGNIFSNFIIIFKENPVSTFILMMFGLVIIILCLFLLWLVIVSQAGLIDCASKIIKNEKKQLPTIKQGIETGMKNFWSVLGLNLTINTFIYFLAVIVGLPLIFVAVKPAGNVDWLYFILFLIFIPLALIFSFLLKYAICFVVIKGRGFVDSMVDAWRLFLKNWLISLEMAFILFFIDVLFVLVFALLLLSIAIPYVFICFGLASLFSLNIFWLMFVFGLAIAIILIILGGSIITCFKLVAWTDLFMSLTGKGGLPKIIRFAEGMKK